MNTSDLLQFEPFCVLNGQKGLHDTERNLVKQLNQRNIEVFVLDDLFKDTEKLKAIKYLKPKTLVLGTTGTYREDLDKTKDLFKSIGYYPENVIFTMGEDYFYEMLNENNIKSYSLLPLQWSDDEIIIEEITD